MARIRSSLATLVVLTGLVAGQVPDTPCWETDIASLEKAVKRAPKNVGFRLRLTSALLRADLESAHPDRARERLEKARAQFAAILTLQPGNQDALRARIIDAYSRRDFESVVRDGRALLGSTKVDVDATLYVVRSMVRLGRGDDAARTLVSWIQTGAIRSFGEAQGIMRLMAADRKRAKALLGAFDEALGGQPGNLHLLLYKAVLLAQVGRNVDSWKSFHQAEKLGLCSLRTGHRHPFARELLERSMEPDEGPWSYAGTRLEELEASFAKAPDHAGLAMRAARVLDTGSESKAALAWYAKAVKANPTLWSAVYRQARIQADEKHFKTAVPLFEKAVSIVPDMQAGRLRLAQALAHAGQLPRVRELLLGFAREYPPEALTRSTLEVIKEAGALDTWLADLDKALVAASSNSRLYAHRALALKVAGRGAEARTAALLAESHGLAGARGAAHPLVLEAFDRLPAKKGSAGGPR